MLSEDILPCRLFIQLIYFFSDYRNDRTIFLQVLWLTPKGFMQFSITGMLDHLKLLFTSLLLKKYLTISAPTAPCTFMNKNLQHSRIWVLWHLADLHLFWWNAIKHDSKRREGGEWFHFPSVIKVKLHKARVSWHHCLFFTLKFFFKKGWLHQYWSQLFAITYS